ncbi:MAG: hypothetical protein BroJett025_04710 [Patescibacteria group bacterium]|nr:MAG: hypothetical protein BroJett025_04710 [Patescibacteria group bacterium]
MNKIARLIAVLLLIVVTWFQRHIFFDTFDPKYAHDHYSMSQWAVPLSSRIMGDADLFTYSGYSLTQEFKPFSVNPETPVFAKLFFGYSAFLFGNQHLASPLFLLLLLLAMDNLAKSYFKFDTTKRIFLALFIFCSAEIQEQVKLTLLDLPQVALFAWHLVFLFKSARNNKNTFKNLAIAGMFLGFMTATKFGLYTPFIILADVWYLFKNKQLKLTPLLLISSITGYLLPYLPVLVSDGLISFLQAQKWTLNFYLSSDVIAPIGMLIITSFTGLNRGWVDTNWQTIFTWNGEWGLGIIALLITIKDWFKSKAPKNSELGAILVSLSLIFLLLLKIPFWPRYLIFFIPFFWLFVLNTIKEKRVLLLLLVFPLITTSKLVLQSYMPPTDYLAFVNSGAYEELYNYFSQHFKSEISREEFTAKSILEYEDLHPSSIETIIESETQTLKTTEQIIILTLKSPFGEKIIRKKYYGNMNMAAGESLRLRI